MSRVRYEGEVKFYKNAAGCQVVLCDEETHASTFSHLQPVSIEEAHELMMLDLYNLVVHAPNFGVTLVSPEPGSLSY